MAGIFGEQVAGELMKIHKDIPIMLYTGHSDAVDEKKARQIGIKGFAMKPLNMGKLGKGCQGGVKWMMCTGICRIESQVIISTGLHFVRCGFSHICHL